MPDEVVRRAEQVQLVDMSPEALRRRMAHGNIYGPDKVDAALANYFRTGNLSALREIALLWLADRVDEALERYRADQGISEQWPARERVVVALTGGQGSETLLRRGARIATRASGGDLIACHVRSAEGLATTDPAVLARLRRLAADLGAEFHDVSGHDVADAILDHARGVNATQVVVGVSRRSRWQQILRPSIASEVADGSGDIDVHLVSHEGSRVGHRRRRTGGLPVRRVVGGLLLAVVSLAALTGLLVATREGHTLSLDLLLYLALTVACALVGGIWPALFCAVVGSLVVNWFFTEPRGTLTISDPPNALALAVFVLVAMAVSSVVNVAARRTEQAVSAERESAALAAMSRDLLAEPRPLPALLDRARDDLGMLRAVLGEVRPDGPATVVASTDPALPAGSPLPVGTAWAVDVTVDDGVHLLLDGPPVAAEDQRVVNAYAAHAAILHAREQLVRAARDAAGLARDNAARTTLLAAVSHDLRTPLSSIKAGVSTLRQAGLDLSAEDEAELLESVEESADRLDALIGNLLDLSRLETGALRAHHHRRRPARRRRLHGAHHLRAGPRRGRPRGRPPSRAGRPRPARPGAGQPRRERTAAQRRRRGAAHGRAHRLARRAAGRRPGARCRGRRQGADLRGVPAGRRQPPGRRARPRARRGTRPHHRHGRHARARGHPGRRPDDGRLAPARPRRPRHDHRHRGGRVSRVLVVDDDPRLQRTLTIALRAHGNEVVTAADGRTAVQSVSEDLPDVVILDLGLPDLDGTEVLRRIRATSVVPVIVLSARHESDDKIEALDLGADDYVTKPFGVEELLARVRAAVRRGGDVGRHLEPVTTTTSGSTSPSAERRSRVRRCGSPRPSGGSSRRCAASPATSCCSRTCSAPSGARRTAASRTTCASTPTSCAASSSRTPPRRGTSSPSPGSATASTPDPHRREAIFCGPAPVEGPNLASPTRTKGHSSRPPGRRVADPWARARAHSGLSTGGTREHRPFDGGGGSDQSRSR